MSTQEIIKLHERIDKMAEKLAIVVTDCEWMKKFMWVVITASVSSLVGTLFLIISKN